MTSTRSPASQQPDLVTGQTGHHASRSTLDLLEDDLVSYVFGGHEAFDPKVKIFVSANDDQDFITYEQAFHAVKNIALQLKKFGLAPGQCVCIHSFNHIHYPLFWLGVIAAGGVVTGSNPAYTTQELVHHFRITNTKLVIVHANRLAAIDTATKECHIDQKDIFSFGGGEAFNEQCHNPWRVSFQPQAESSTTLVAQSDQVAGQSTLVAYAATSGTTGLPKAAGLSHRYFIAQLVAIEELYRNRDGSITQLHCLPVFHAFAAPIALLLPLRLGITTYFLPRFNPQHFVNAVQRFQITDTAVVPPIIATLSKLTHDQHDLLQSLRFMICAGAPLATSVQADLMRILHPELVISQCWGCTEVGWISTFCSEERDSSGSVGRLLANTYLKIVDADGGIVVIDGSPGEAFVKSGSMFEGYRTSDRSVDKSELCDDEGYYGTGDVVYVKNGKIYIHGRIKDIIKVNGWQVSPDEIQNVIMQLANDGILDCAVLGRMVTDQHGLQITLPRAYVVKSANSSIQAQDILTHIKKELVSYKQITRGVVFVDQIPRNPTGKILRRLLEDASPSEQTGNDEHGPQAVNTQEYHERCKVILWFVLGPVVVIIIAAIIEKVLRAC